MVNVQIAERRAMSVSSSLFPHLRPLLSSLCRLCPVGCLPGRLCSAPLDSRCRREERHQDSLEGRLSHPLVARNSRILLQTTTRYPHLRVLTTRHLRKTEVVSHSDGCTRRSTGNGYPLRTSTVNLTHEDALPHPLRLVALRRNMSTHRRTERLLLASGERALTHLLKLGSKGAV